MIFNKIYLTRCVKNIHLLLLTIASSVQTLISQATVLDIDPLKHNLHALRK